MTFNLTVTELQHLALVSDEDLVGIAAELDMVPDEVIDRATLLSDVIPRLLDLARRERGLPFSKYDAENIEALASEDRAALARAMGWRKSDVPSMIKAGGKVYKSYRRSRTGSQVPLMLPLLLASLARCARVSEESGS